MENGFGVMFLGENIRGMFRKIVLLGCPMQDYNLVLLYMCSGYEDVGHPG